MSRLIHWISENQLVSFFALSFTISWGLLLLLGPLYANGVVLVVPLLMLALYGPALAGIIISAILHPQPRQATPKARLLTFFLTWLAATPVFVFTPESRPEGVELSFGLVAVAAVIALIPAWIVSSAFSRTPGVRIFLEALLKPRGSVTCYLTAVLIVPSLLLISALVTVVLGYELPAARVSVDGGWPMLLGLFLLSAAYRFFYANACGEEPGWRGFALPRLQARFNPLVANLILAFFWALWHLPLPQARGLVNPAAFLEYYIGTFCHCIIIAWLFNKTRGSILVAGLVHVFSNVSRLYIPETTAFTLVRPAFCVVLIILYRMWEKLPDNDNGTAACPS